MRPLALLALLAPGSALAERPLGSEIAPSLAVDITPEGFEAVSAVVGEVVPEQVAVDIPRMSDRGGCVLGYCAWEYELEFRQVSIQPALDHLSLTPVPGRIALDAALEIAIGTSSRPIVLDLDADIVSLIDVNQTCYAAIDRFPVELATDVALQVVPDGAGGRRIDATVGTIDWQADLDGSDIDLWGSGCAVDDIRSFFQWFGWDPFDLVIDYAWDELGSTIQDLRADIEVQIEEIFASAVIDQQVALGDAVLDVRAHPYDVEIGDEGLRIAMSGSFDTEMHDCVLPYATSGSLETPSEPPALGSAPEGVVSPHHVGIQVDDDFVNQGLYGAWAGGLLCQRLAKEDGLPIDTTLLNLLSREAYEDLFPETSPMLLVTRPAQPPVASTQGEHHLDVAVDELGVDFYADLDHRRARILGAELATDVGIDLGFDDAVGELLVDLDFSPADIGVTLTANEFAPGQDQALLDGFATLFDVVLDPLVGGFLDDLRFAMPAFEGMGLTVLDAAPAGASGDWLGLYAQAGPVTYEAAGCNDAGSGCEGGCGGGRSPSHGLLWLVPVVAAALRRRSPARQA